MKEVHLVEYRSWSGRATASWSERATPIACLDSIELANRFVELRAKKYGTSKENYFLKTIPLLGTDEEIVEFMEEP